MAGTTIEKPADSELDQHAQRRNRAAEDANTFKR